MREGSDWMFTDAMRTLARAERMHRRLAGPEMPSELPTKSHDRHKPHWEPPVDILETQSDVLIFFALPGVDPDEVDVAIDEGSLLVSGRRLLPQELRVAVIHRLELAHGRFERRIELPSGHYDTVRRHAANGCIVFSLRKTAEGLNRSEGSKR